MEFKEGGHWIYAMIEPNGTEYWGRMNYLKISPIDSTKHWMGYVIQMANLIRKCPDLNGR